MSEVSGRSSREVKSPNDMMASFFLSKQFLLHEDITVSDKFLCNLWINEIDKCGSPQSWSTLLWKLKFITMNRESILV